MKQVRALVVDDEASGRQALISILEEEFPEIKLVGEAGSCSAGISLIREFQPDLVFLDIEMADGTGFDLISRLEQVSFETIFITAYSDYALDAFRHNAVGYLLKPVDPRDLRKVVERSLEFMGRSESELSAQMGRLLEGIRHYSQRPSKLILPDAEGFQLIDTGAVIRLEGDRNYTKVHLSDHKVIHSSYNLGWFEKSLPAQEFLRVSKSHLVNISHILRYSRVDGGTIYMSDKSAVRVSSGMRDEIRKLFN